MPIPHPNLPSSIDPQLREYIRLLHSHNVELESKLSELQQQHKSLSITISTLQKQIKQIDDN
jgi:prefoldin subunit 5